MEKISEETRIEQLLSEYPLMSKTFIEYGLPCLICGEPFWGTIKELGDQHAVSIADLLKRLNNELKKNYGKS